MSGMAPVQIGDTASPDALIRVVGHSWAGDLLRRQLSQGQSGHAYLFSGPLQVGRGTLARWFAQALLCQESESPCGVCQTCRQVVSATHPDLRLLNLANQPGKRRRLGIEAIRNLRKGMAERPFRGQRKVYLIEDAETMTVEASNALLKMLEEPPSFVVLMLVAISDHLLLETIVSRCQVLSLRPLGRDEVQQALVERWGAEEDRAELLAALSLGRLGWAVQALQDSALLKQRDEDLTALTQLMEAGLLKRFDFAVKQERRWKRGKRTEVFKLLECWQGWWRDLMLVGQDCSELICNVDRLAELQAAGQQIGPDRTLAFLQLLRTAQQRLEEQVNPRLLWEDLLLQLPAVVISA